MLVKNHKPVYRKLISGMLFEDILEDFAVAVKDGLYEKIDYQIWKRLKELSKHSLIEMEWQQVFSDDVDYHIRLADMDFSPIYLYSTDESFGEFFFNYELKQWIPSAECANPRLFQPTYSTSNLQTYEKEDKSPYDYKEALIYGGRSVGKTLASSSNDSHKYVWLDSENTKTNATSNFEDEYLCNWNPLAIEDKLQELEEVLNGVKVKIDTKQDKINENNIYKENSTMKGFNFDFGPVSGSTVRMSMYGFAIRNQSGTYVSYNPATEEIVDVDIFNVDCASQFFYKMPVAIKDIAVGDIIVHQNKPMFVVAVTESNSLIVVDPVAGERKDIMLTRSPFGFNFATKVVNLVGDAFGAKADADNPFGNMWMLMAMGGDSKSFKDMLPMMLFAQGGNIDPTMAMFLAMSDGKSNDAMIPLMFAMNGGFGKSHCSGKCGGGCHCENPEA